MTALGWGWRRRKFTSSFLSHIRLTFFWKKISLKKQIGFPNLKNYLESLLLEKYKLNIPHTFSLLNSKCKEIETELIKVNELIDSMQVKKLRARASDYIIDLTQNLVRYLKVRITSSLFYMYVYFLISRVQSKGIH